MLHTGHLASSPAPGQCASITNLYVLAAAMENTAPSNMKSRYPLHGSESYSSSNNLLFSMRETTIYM